MDRLHDLLDVFVRQSRHILGENLVGVYLHGSAAMDCFHWESSDIDLLVVVRNGMSDDEKGRYMQMVAAQNENAPPKGLELSVIRQDVCDPFVYPTPFELHFSAAHLEWYRADPADYIQKMRGEDRDLAAHITILRHRGETLWGKAVPEVFGPVDHAFYFDSIRSDVAQAPEDILRDPVYCSLNLCRVLAYKECRLILSKSEGGQWGMEHLPVQYHGLVRAALRAYEEQMPMHPEAALAVEYAEYMLGRIRA